MFDVPLHPAEEARLAQLLNCALLDTDPEPGYDDAVQVAATIFETPSAAFTLIDQDRQWFKAREGLTFHQSPRFASICAHVVAQNLPLVLEDAAKDPKFRDHPMVAGYPGVRFYAGVPVRSPEGLPLGSVCVFDYVPRCPTDRQLKCLHAISRQLGALIASRIDNQRLEQYAVEISEARLQLEMQANALEDANQLLEALASTDALTGLLNRRALILRLEEEQLTASEERPLSVMLVDVDHFKQFNDEYGHQVGDDVLRRVAGILRSGCRGTDVVGRYGGEEFCIGLFNASLDVAQRVAERMCRAVAKANWPHRTVTISIGLAAAPFPRDIDETLRMADEALYESKRQGRDQVRVAA